MGKLIKIVLGLIAVLIVAIIVIPMVIDPNDYRDQIQAEVKKATGRDLTIGGDLNLSVFPWVGVEINQVELSNAAGFSDKPFAKMELAEVKVKLIPLLSQKVEVSRVVLNGLRLNLEKNKAGTTNWDDLAQPTSEQPKTESKQDQSSAPAVAAIAVGGLQIEDAQLNWSDASTGEQYTISQFNLITDALKFDDPMKVDMGLTLSSQKPEMTARLELDGDLILDQSLQTLQFKGMQLVLDTAGEPIPNGAMKINVFSNVAGDLSDKGSVALNDLKIQFDDTTFNGRTSVTNFSNPAIRFSLAGDRLDVDRYLPPAKDGEQAANASPATGAAGAALIPVETLRGLNVVGDVSIQKLIFNGLKADGVKVDIDARNGVLKSTQAVEQFYQGKYAGQTTVDARKKTPVISVNEKANGIQISPLLTDLMGESMISGAANISAKVKTRGNSIDAFKANLNGTSNFSFTDGAVKGINVAAKIREAQSLLKGQKAAASTGPNSTDFSEIKGTANITNGLVKNNDLTVSSPLLRISGKGNVHLVKETIDYALTTKVVGSLEGQNAKDAEDLRKLTIPIVVGGNFAKPTYRLDLKSMLAESQKAKIDEKKAELKEKVDEKIKGKIGDKAGELLKGFF